MFIILVLFCFSFCFFSCENFLQGGTLKKELEDAISYSKAEKTSVRINVETTAYGDISPASVILLKEESVKIEFIKKTECDFYEWIVLDSSTKTSLDEKFFKLGDTTLESYKDGLDKLSVTLTLTKNYIPNIEIYPRC